MQVETSHPHIDLPVGMRTKLESFRRRLWFIKLAEGILAGLFGFLLSYLLVFSLDRLYDTPTWLRTLILLLGVLGLGIWFPLKWHRWVWSTRQLEQVARLLRRRFPRLGDQLLGIVELAHSEREQHRSEALCRAAMRQVDQEARKQDFDDAVPSPRHRFWAWSLVVPVLLVLGALVLVPAAGTNALVRWLTPWKNTPRYTFAQLQSVPDSVVVPLAEPFDITARLTDSTAWEPSQGSARYGQQDPVRANLDDGRYQFEIPPQKSPEKLKLAIGDARASIRIEPTARPELTSINAQIQLPSYLQYPDSQTKDVRGGSVSIVKGSQAVFTAAATRNLKDATADGVAARIDGPRLITAAQPVETDKTVQLAWQDELGLSAKDPFKLTIRAVDDEAPTLACSDLTREQVVLSTEVLRFQIATEDDFGIKEIGLQWEGVEDPLRNPKPTRGEKPLDGGHPEKTSVEATAVFSAEREGIRPQTLKLRAYAIDYLPGRERVYSPTYVLYVLSPEEHAIWITNQMRKWFRRAEEVYEREQQLHLSNQELRDLPGGEIDRPENRRRIETQAAAEQANARQLAALTTAGEGLVQQAVKNDQFNVETLENWAQMLQALKEIADQRMPSVADLLKEAAQAPGQVSTVPAAADTPQSSDEETPPQVGVNRDGRSGKGAPAEPQKEAGKVPSIMDVESGFNELDEQQESEQEESQSSPRLSLPSTAVVGGGAKQDGGEAEPSPATEKMEEAVQQQEDLLAEFAKIADELKKILDNLEGSTFVKRLKAASRRQLEVAGDLNSGLTDSFGVAPNRLTKSLKQQTEKVAEREQAQSESIYIIQEDLDAYYNRVREGKFKTVLSEMRDTKVVGKLRQLAGDVETNLSGQSIAQAEFWADALDRWAEQLVGPG
jgi:hypothetical protein